CGSNLDCYVEYLGQLWVPAHVVAESFAFDELCRDESHAFGAADFINSENVWMIESRRGFRFEDETVQPALMSGELGEQEFQSYRSPEFGVLRPVHLTHSACTNFADDAIMGKRSAGGKFSHRCLLYATAALSASERALPQKIRFSRTQL